MNHQNLDFLRDMFLQTQQICSWTMTSDMQLLVSNCPEQDYFYNLFLISPSRACVEEHFAGGETVPLVVSDRTGLVWMAVSGPAKAEKVSLVYLLGPVFTSTITEAHIRQHCRRLHLTPEAIERLWAFIMNVPIITSHMAICYAAMLHYCVNGKAVSTEDILIRNEHIEHSSDVAWGDVGWHGSWITEQRMFNSIKEGRLEDFGNLNTGNVGNMSDDALRQAKNEIIVFAVLCSRAAIFGGVSSEGALNMSDYFVRLVEEATSIPEITDIAAEMQRAFVERVQRAKADGYESPLVRACREYVETHILEKISLHEMAQQIGYNEQYISRAYKSETKESLVEYINGRKIELAMALLREGKMPVAEIGERLSFSSPSYFSTLFKKKTGVSPAAYQQKQQEATKNVEQQSTETN